MGSEPWVRWVFEAAKRALNDATADREHVQVRVEALKTDDRFRQLRDAEGRNFWMWEAFCTTPQPHGLGYSPEAIDAIIAERKSVAAMDRAQVTTVLAESGGDRRSEVAKEFQVDVVNLKTKGGNDADYLTARIARDRPDILERMTAGVGDRALTAAQ